MGFHGLHRYQVGAPMPRHRHAKPYMAIVVDGGYLEAGDSGRIEARPGDVLLHGVYEAHRDAFLPSGATVLNLPISRDIPSGFGRVADVDALVRLADRDARLASIEACTQLEPRDGLIADWPDLLAAALNADPNLSIAGWADCVGLTAASVSRGFAKAYGISPKRFRLEARVRNTIRQLAHWRDSLASLAAEQGFADQAHMARSVVAMTGQSPARLRAKSVQADGAPTR